MPRKMIDPIVEECLALVYPMEPAAKHALWQRLWQQHMEGEKRQSALPEVAELLTSTGAWLAYDQHDFPRAHNYLAEFLRSPQASEIDYSSNALLMGMQFMCLLFLNREAEALQIVPQLLNAPRPSDVYSNVITLRGFLASFFMQQKEDELASEAVTQLFYDLLRRTRHKKFQTMPQRATYGDLHALLIEACDAWERARQKRVAREQARNPTD